jgi:hypothetical protein
MRRRGALRVHAAARRHRRARVDCRGCHGDRCQDAPGAWCL